MSTNDRAAGNDTNQSGFTTVSGFGDEIVWRPPAEALERSRLLRFMRDHGIPSYDDLLTRAVAEPEWYWDAVVEHLGLEWFEPYTKVLDLRDGPAWPHWFVNGRYNYVHDAVDKWANAPDANRAAIIWEGDDGASRRLTFGELAQETNRLANALRSLGIAKGDRVGIFMPMLPETAIATLACGKIGAIFTPIFSGYGVEAVASRLRDCEATLLITADGFHRRGKTIPMKETADAALAEAPSVRQVLVYRHTGEEIPWQEGRDHWWQKALDGMPDECPTEQTSGDDPYMIIYTSGTTGRPKGAVHSHAGFPIKAAHDLAFCFDLQPDDVLFWVTDLGWMMGPWAIEGSLLLGAAVLLFEGTPDYPAPDRLWQLCEAHGATVLGISPTAIRALMARGDDFATGHGLTALRAFGSTGEPWNPEPWRWLFEVPGERSRPILNYSGGTEISGGITGCVSIRTQKPCTFTGAVPGMAADVVDGDGNPVRGEVGELVIRAPWVGMTNGFWNDPDGERYQQSYWSRWPDIWVHGDWALIDDDGFWYILGRSDDTIKAAGKRVGPAEVESAAVAHPAVQEAAAVGVPDPVKGEAIVLFAILRPGETDTEELREAIREEVAQRLGRPLRPSSVVIVGDLPRTRSAKVMRRVIRAAYLGQEPGDLSSLENPAAVDEIRRAVG